jgi:hypothetical protein
MKDLKEFLNESIVKEAHIDDEELELKKDYEWCYPEELDDLEADGLIDSKDMDAIMDMKKGKMIVLPKGSTLTDNGSDRFYQYYELNPGKIVIPILQDELGGLIKHCK